MTDPYEVLGIGQNAEPDEIRRRYLELVRRHSPEREPKRFATIREAYDHLRDPVVHLKKRLFSFKCSHTMDDLAHQAQPNFREHRIPTETLLSLGQP